MFSQAVGTAAEGSQGGVVLVVSDRPEVWSVELMRFHGLNVVRCEFLYGGQQTPLIGYYLPLSTLDELPDIEEAMD